jgi:hypothetical protein
MIGSVSPVGSYAVQRYAQVNPVSAHGAAAAEKSSVITARKSFDLETPVQAAEAVKPVTTGVSGNISVDLTKRQDAEAAELSARLRMSSVEEDSVRTEPEAEKAEQRERLEAEEKAEARREAYREKLEEEQAARDERVEALREELKGEESDETGSLELDHTSALLRNYQMNNLMQDMLSAKTRGEDTRGYSAAIDALLESSQNRVTFSTEKAEAANAHRYYQQQVKQTDSVFGAVA